MKNNKEQLSQLLSMLDKRQENAELILTQRYNNSKDEVCTIKTKVDKDKSLLIVDIYFNGEIFFNGTLKQLKEQLKYLPPCCC